MQVEDHAGFEYCRDSGGKRIGRIFVGKFDGDSDIIRIMQNRNPHSWHKLAQSIRTWAHELGFRATGIADTDLSQAEAGLLQWLSHGFNGRMDYMAKHGVKRSRPAELVPGTLRVISVRMDYLPDNIRKGEEVLRQTDRGYISRYALGRDYHKVMRNRLAQLAERIRAEVAEFEGRVFTDSAPVMEVALACKAGLGWRGKHTLLLSRDAGSWFFLGEIYVNLPLPVDEASQSHCGGCVRCIESCPTGAIVAPYRLDARLCISYLTIELDGSIPVELRPLIGNRIYGCDDCQMVCPWNRFAQISAEPDFAARHELDDAKLVDLFAWDQDMFRTRTAGSAIHRIGHERWLRNIAVALGNADASDLIVAALQSRASDPSALVREHVSWALQRQASSGLAAPR